MAGCTKPITVAVMGCVVNGPGEASAADVGIAGGDGVGLLFRRGEIVKKVPQEQLVDELFKMIFVIIEMLGSVCYSSIIEGKPDTVDNMKPVLYGIVRKILS